MNADAPGLLAARIIPTPLGPVKASATARGLRSLWFVEPSAAALAPESSSPILDLLEEELAAYFAGDLHRFTVPLDLAGTPFRRAVWDQLLAIPYGRTTSYDTIAAALALPGGQRAVGQANGANPVAIVVPCHRVITKGGGIGGYAGGLDRKRFLLALEARTVPAEPPALWAVAAAG